MATITVTLNNPSDYRANGNGLLTVIGLSYYRANRLLG